MTNPPVPVFLINLDRDEARLAHMSDELGAAGLAFERVPAVQGSAAPGGVAEYFLDTSGAIASSLKRGEVGCYASHLMIHERILRERLGPVLVLEDDLRLPADFGSLLASLLATLPADWEIVRLSNAPKSAYVPLAALGAGRELVRYSKIPNNTGAYLINERGAARFLAGPRPRRRAVDEDLRRPWDFGPTSYGVVPPPVISNIFDSTIDSLEERNLRVRRRTPKILTGRTEGPLGALRRAGYNMRVLGMGPWLRCLVNNLGRAIGRRRRKRGDHSDFSALRVE